LESWNDFVFSSVVVAVDILNSGLEGREELGGLLAKLLGQWLVKVKQMLDVDANEILSFACVSLQLVSNK
jgi:hypothetical protein